MREPKIVKNENGKYVWNGFEGPNETVLEDYFDIRIQIKLDKYSSNICGGSEYSKTIKNNLEEEIGDCYSIYYSRNDSYYFKINNYWCDKYHGNKNRIEIIADEIYRKIINIIGNIDYNKNGKYDIEIISCTDYLGKELNGTNIVSVALCPRTIIKFEPNLVNWYMVSRYCKLGKYLYNYYKDYIIFDIVDKKKNKELFELLNYDIIHDRFKYEKSDKSLHELRRVPISNNLNILKKEYPKEKKIKPQDNNIRESKTTELLYEPKSNNIIANADNYHHKVNQNIDDYLNNLSQNVEIIAQPENNAKNILINDYGRGLKVGGVSTIPRYILPDLIIRISKGEEYQIYKYKENGYIFGYERDIKLYKVLDSDHIDELLSITNTLTSSGEDEFEFVGNDSEKYQLLTKYTDILNKAREIVKYNENIKNDIDKLSSHYSDNYSFSDYQHAMNKSVDKFESTIQPTDEQQMIMDSVPESSELVTTYIGLNNYKEILIDIEYYNQYMWMFLSRRCNLSPDFCIKFKQKINLPELMKNKHFNELMKNNKFFDSFIDDIKHYKDSQKVLMGYANNQRVKGEEQVEMIKYKGILIPECEMM